MESQRYAANLQKDEKANEEMTQVRSLVKRFKILKTNMQRTLARFDDDSSGTIPMEYFDKAIAKLFSRVKLRDEPDWETVKQHYGDGARDVQFRYRPFIIECYRKEDVNAAFASRGTNDELTKFNIGSNVDGRLEYFFCATQSHNRVDLF